MAIAGGSCGRFRGIVAYLGALPSMVAIASQASWPTVTDLRRKDRVIGEQYDRLSLPNDTITTHSRHCLIIRPRVD
jgi:hypothetical protein